MVLLRGLAWLHSPLTLPASFFACNLPYLVIWPSKTLCIINLLIKLLHSSREGHRCLCFGASWSPMAFWSPRCLPDFSRMPPRYLSRQWFLLYDSPSNVSSSMISSLCLLLQSFLLHDSSSSISLSWLLKLVYKKTLFGVSCWGHCSAGVVL